MFSFIPFDITPYTQRITWVRPDRLIAGEPFDIRVSGSREVIFFWFTTTFQEKFKTLEKSFVDYFLDMSNYKPYPADIADLKYDRYYQMDYEDYYFSYKPIEQLLDVSQSWLQWYGSHEYYGYWFLDKYAQGAYY